jgi:hydroxymethylpyrimidine/phosphomethylpyrimidine kinase
LINTVLTVAGSDSSGGAGIQADIKTITAHKMYAMSAITAITAQNTTGVYGIMDASPEIVAGQLDCIFTDIFPDAVKIGMVSNSDLITVIAEKLRHYRAKNIVIDPVMVSTSGSKLLCDSAMDTLISKLLPLGTVVTPNIPEAEVLSGTTVQTKEDMIRAAALIAKQLNCAVLVKGGHLSSDASDLLYENDICRWYYGIHVENPNTHGTGCTLSSAIACNLAAGYDLDTSIKNAKAYLTGALQAGLNLGNGSGPLDHTYALDIKYSNQE